MVEPASAAVSGLAKAVATQAGKKITARSGVRLGSRDERRQVYGRFQAVMVEAISFSQRMRIERKIAPWLSFSSKVSRELALQAHELQTELLQAYMELRLVANPGPMAVGDDALEAVGKLLNMSGVKQRAFDTQLELATAGQRAFTEACGNDLWYTPQPWQVYRVGWWTAVWGRRPWRKHRPAELQR